MNIAENIARLRRERGLTQEALAELLGVAPQTISKWENAVTLPDVALLPVLADFFGVSIDALYGRDSARKGIPADRAIDKAIEGIQEVVTAIIYDFMSDTTFDAELTKYRRVMQKDTENRSVIENDRDVLYYRDKVGALVLRKPEDGWNTLFADDAALEIIRLLADDGFRRAMQVILSRRMLNFTLPTLAKAAQVDDPEHLGVLLKSSGLFTEQELSIDESTMHYYHLSGGENNLYLLFAVLTFARELKTYEPQHYCFIGNSNYYTP